MGKIEGIIIKDAQVNYYRSKVTPKKSSIDHLRIFCLVDGITSYGMGQGYKGDVEKLHMYITKNSLMTIQYEKLDSILTDLVKDGLLRMDRVKCAYGLNTFFTDCISSTRTWFENFKEEN